MCLPKTPKVPKAPAMPQAPKLPDTQPLRAQRSSAGALAAPGGSTLLTGPSGVAQSSLVIGRSSLLGGGTK